MVRPTPLRESAEGGTIEHQGTATVLLPPGVLRSFILVTGLFFLWGIPNNLNDVLIR